MKRYYIRENTPLKYHNFLRYFALPLSMLTTLGNALRTFQTADSSSWLFAVDMVYFAIGMVLLLTAFIGFFSWNSSAWYAILSFVWLNAVYGVYLIAIYVLYVPNDIATAVGSLIGSSIYAFLMTVYYRKRRPLFFPAMIPAGYRPEPDEPQEKPCPSCGSMISRDDRCCNHCGFQLPAIGAQESPQPRERVCPSCGRKIPEYSKGCLFCGGTGVYSGPEVEEKPAGKKKWIVLGVFAAVILVAVILCIALLGGNSDSERLLAASQPTQTQEPEPTSTPTPAPTPASAAARQQAAFDALWNWVEENYNYTWADGSICYEFFAGSEEFPAYLDVILEDQDTILLRYQWEGEGVLAVGYLDLRPEETLVYADFYGYELPYTDEPMCYGISFVPAGMFREDSIIPFDEYEGPAEELSGAEEIASLLYYYALLLCDALLSGQVPGSYSVADFGFTGVHFDFTGMS